jgi:hypothetical protein
MPQVMDHYRKMEHNRASGLEDRQFQWYRLEDIDSLDPIRCWVGEQSWKGYVVFEFSETRRVVLECPFEGNATYILWGNWKSMIGDTKAQIRDDHPDEHLRVLHRTDWLDRIRQALRER